MTTTKKRKVLNYLYNGNGLTKAEASSRFGVANLRAMISDIRQTIVEPGNLEIVSEETPTGKTRYFMNVDKRSSNHKLFL